jgi:hypothetical protein
MFALIRSYCLFIFLAINGKIFGNFHGLIMNEDTMTNWYLLGIGSEVDIHTIHYHAESFLFKVSIRNMLWGNCFFSFFLLFYYSYVHTRLGSFLPPGPPPSLTTHSAPFLSLPPSIPSRNYFALISNFVEERV